MSQSKDFQPKLSPTKQALLAVKEMQAKLAAHEYARKEPIAIVGMGCRFPGASNSPDEFWQLLSTGTDAIGLMPRDRWDFDAFYDPEAAAQGKMYVQKGGFLDQVDRFDPLFFGISPREAASMDPQQRLLLEVGWEALENSGYAPEELIGSQTGAFVGIMNLDYFQIATIPEIVDAHTATGTALSVASGRLSYSFGFQGPSVAVDTACSSSLVAVHLACQSLRSRECNMALAAGVNLILSPRGTILECRARMLSPEGHCKTFDAEANGYARGEGCGVVVLKRLSDAITEGDNILALVRGSAVNQDGRSGGLTVPNGPAQQAVIRKALENADLQPEQVSYVEAHGTGTALGDPIELRALGTVFSSNRPTDQPLLVGSVKTNFGHLESASGIAGLIKLVLALQHREIPPHIKLKTPSPQIPWSELPIRVTTQATPWQVPAGSRIGGLSSFGFSGTNAHIFLEEAPEETVSAQTIATAPGSRPAHLFTISAKNEAALTQLALKYVDHLQTHPEQALSDICHTTNQSRSQFEQRLAVAAETPAELEESLTAFANGLISPTVSQGQASHCEPRVVFLFTGQGAQYINMGRQLYDTQPVFRQALDRCDQILRPYLDKPLLSVIYPPAGEASPLNQTAYTQPALFAIEYALSELWQSWGIRPTAVLGHSIGEYVAACVAGVYSLEAGLKLIAERGRLMQALPTGGQMAAVLAPREQVVELIQPYVNEIQIAAINSPENTVISGPAKAVSAFCTQLENQAVDVRPLVVSHAFHSALMEPMLEDFKQVAASLEFQSPTLDLISSVTGGIMTTEVTSADYWCRQVRQPVNFVPALQTLAAQGYNLFVEVGPHPVLLSLARQTLSTGTWVPSLRRGQQDWPQLLSSLGALWCHGAAIDWTSYGTGYTGRRVPLPTYAWQRDRYWVEDSPHSPTRQPIQLQTEGHPLLGQPLSTALKETLFESAVSLNRPAFLVGHQVAGLGVLPAAAYLESALAAGAKQFGSNSCTLTDVAIQAACLLSAEASHRLQLILSPDGEFRIFSRDQAEPDAAWSSHAIGKIAPLTTQPAALPLSELQARIAEPVDVSAYYQQLCDRGLEYGPTFQGIQQLWRCEGEALGHIQLPEILMAEAVAYQLHPVLLDSSFQMLFATLSDIQSGDTYLPVGLGQLQIYQRPTASVWAHVQLQPGEDPAAARGNIQLLEADGTLIAKVEGLQLKRVSVEALQQLSQQPLQDWLYQVDWQLKPRTVSSESSPQAATWLILADRAGLAKQLAKHFTAQGQDCILIRPGKTYKTSSKRPWYINPNRPEDWQQLCEAVLRSGPPLRGIIHLWGLDATECLETAQVLGCRSTLHLLQEFDQALRATGGKLWLATRGAQAVAAIAEKSAAVDATYASLWGIGRVAALESPDLWGGLIDLDPAAPAIATEMPLLTGELEQPEAGHLAFRDGQRYEARLSRYRPTAEATAPSITSEGTYLITGGTGGLGLKVAHWLVEQGAKQLVLISRRGLTARSQAAVQALEAAGAQVRVAKADIAVEAEVARLLTELAEDLPPLRGVIHAAGVLNDGLLQQQDWSRFTQVMAPKILGAWHLHQHTQTSPLDFFVLFSSAAALLGSPGQGNYAAANAFMDALAHQRLAQGLPAISINWGTWAEAGMAASLGEREQQRLRALGVSPILPQQGLDVLEHLLQQSAAQVGVMPIRWEQFLQQFPVPPAFLSELVSQTSVFAPRKGPGGAIAAELQSAEASERQSLLETYLQTEIARVLGMSAAKLGQQQSLINLGLDSLMLLDIKNRIEADLSTTVPMENFLQDLSISQLATQVLGQMNLDTAPSATDLLAAVDDLSEDQIDALLQSLLAEAT